MLVCQGDGAEGMVYIKRLTLQGFKSFARRVTLNLEKGLVVVTGPNGGGKSNIMDAIRFALGELSTHNLRVGRMSELVHDNPSVSSAKVSVTLDNSGRALPIDSPEVTVTRKIDRSGESEYLLNGRQVSRTELLTLLSIANIRPSGFNIIPQGSVIGIAEMSGVELRKMLEEVSGIGDYERRKQEAEQQLAAAEKNLAVAKAGTSEVRLRVKQLERERNQAYRRRHVEVMLASITAARLRKAAESIGRELEELDAESMALEGELADLEAERAEVTRLQGEAEEGWLRASKRLRELEQRLRELEQRRGSLKAEEAVLAAEESTLAERIRRASAELEELEARLREALELEAGFSRRLEAEQAALVKLEAKLEERAEERAKLWSEVEALRRELEEAEERARRLEAERAILGAEAEASRRELKKVKTELEEARAETTALEASLPEVFLKCRERFLELKRAELEAKELRRTLRDAEERVRGLKAMLGKARELERRLSGLVEVAGSSGMLGHGATRERVKEVIQAIEGVRGFLDEWLEVDSPETWRRLEASTSGWVRALVVEGWRKAAELAEVLSEAGLEAKIIPLEAIEDSGGPRLPGVRPKSKWAGRALSYILRGAEFSERVRPPKPGDRKIVASSGVTAYPDGRVEVSAPRGREAALLLEREHLAALRILTGLREKIDGLESRLRTAEEERRSSASRLEEARLRAERLRIEADVLITEAASTMLRLAFLEAKEAALKRDGREAEERLKAVVKRLETLKPPNQGALKGLRDRFRELSERYTEVRAGCAGLEAKRDAFSKNIMRLSEELGRVRKQAERLRERLEALRKELAEAETRRGEVEKRLEALREELAQLDSETEGLRTEAEQRRMKVDELTRSLSEFSERLRALDSRFQELSTRRTALAVRRSQLEAELRRVNEELEPLVGYEPPAIPPNLTSELEKALEEELKELEMINQLAPTQYEELVRNYKVRSERIRELEEERAEILRFLGWLEEEKKRAFMRTFNRVTESFEHYFSVLTGGQAWLRLEDPENPFNGGVEMILRFPGKSARSSKSASGGEKSVAAVSLLLALQGLTPADFYVFDEVDAHMDIQYSVRLAELFREMAERTQIIVITLKDVVAEKADQLLGVYMKDGESKIVKTKIEEVMESG